MPEPMRQTRPHNDHQQDAPHPLAATTIHQLRVLGLIEGASFLALLLIAMPLKYLAGLPAAVRYVGMAHGVLFVLYVAAGVWTGVSLRWPLRRMVLVLGAAVLPAGPVLIDGWLRRLEKASGQGVQAAAEQIVGRTLPPR
jgi:integral membrane protein